MRNWIFDLDQTLYTDLVVFDEIHDHLIFNLSEEMGLSPEEVELELYEYRLNSGSTYDFVREKSGNFENSISEMFAIDLVKFLKKDNVLIELLDKLPGRKYVLTDGIRKHAETALDLIGITDFFDGVYCFDDAGYTSKKNKKMYDLFSSKYDLDLRGAVFVEDSVSNLEMGKKLGMCTVHIKGEKTPFIDYSLSSIYELPTIIDLIR